jgi:hypothetical protein
MEHTKHITIGFSAHRPEILPFAAQLMQQHEAIILEEPEIQEFASMLNGKISIEDYLFKTDFEFYEFSKRSCELFRTLYQGGKRFYQVDPFITLLNEIHCFFGDGGKPGNIDPFSAEGAVYSAERSYSASLLAYYEECLTTPFEHVVELVKRFAKEDAVRGRLRDRMRAESIIPLIPSFNTIYIEAGTLHMSLVNQLVGMRSKGYRIRPIYLMAPIVRKLIGHRQTLGPGEKLTLLYTYRPECRSPRVDLLAAQSLIHSKIKIKDEIVSASDEYPHTRDEVETTALVERLGYTDCKSVYAQVKHATTRDALATVRKYLND